MSIRSIPLTITTTITQLTKKITLKTHNHKIIILNMYKGEQVQHSILHRTQVRNPMIRLKLKKLDKLPIVMALICSKLEYSIGRQTIRAAYVNHN